MKIGYARVSTEDQNLALQVAALEKACCDAIYTDRTSGAYLRRPGLDAVLKKLHRGATLVVWRLDRLGRSLRALVDLIHQLGKRGVHFVSLTENISTETSGGMLLFHMMAALAEFERSLISERTKAGMAAARALGRPLGRCRAMSPEQRVEALRALAENRPLKEVAAYYKVHPRTLRRVVALESETLSLGL
ncbi:MAG: recombinase family protein [Pigmentiphaga sp.]|uniref:recombinase family protein n=1 Tax=Pigmentiphaga sp. TaxID=1977564 RepID=UPI003B556EA4